MPSVDPTFGIDEFKRPKVLSETETTVNNILTLLMGEPGFYPSIPYIGINIKQYLYMPIDDIPCEAITAELAKQCSDFAPDINSGEFTIQKSIYNKKPIILVTLPVIDDTKKNVLSIGITVNDKGEYIYNFVEGKYQMI